MPVERREGERENTARRERNAIKCTCPYCKAAPGEPCRNRRNVHEGLKRPHPERVSLARGMP